MASTTPPTQTQTVTAKVNPLVALFNAIFNVLILNGGESAATIAVNAAAPWTKAPVISTIVGWVIDAVATSFNTTVKKWVDNLVIKVQHDVKNAAYKDAQAEFTKVMDASNKTQAEKDAASAAWDVAFDNLVHQNKAALN